MSAPLPAQAMRAQVAQVMQLVTPFLLSVQCLFPPILPFLCIAAGWVVVDKNAHTIGTKQTPVGCRSACVTLLVPPAGSPQSLPDVEPWGSRDLPGEASLWPSAPAANLLRLAVHVVSPNDHVGALPSPGGSHGLSWPRTGSRRRLPCFFL